MGEITPPGDSSGGPAPENRSGAFSGPPGGPEQTDPRWLRDAPPATGSPDPWAPRGPGFDARPAPPSWGPPPGYPPPAFPPPAYPTPGFAGQGHVPVGGATSLRGPSPRRSRLGTVVPLAAATALLVGGAAGYGGSVLAGRPLAEVPASSASTAAPSPVDPGTNGSASPLPAPPPQVDTVEVAKRVLPGTVMIQTGSSTGSGFVLDTSGRIMTNNHVVAAAAEDGERIRVVFSDGRRQSATLVGRSPSYDLAVIKVRGSSGLKPLPFGDSEALEVGQPVIAVGAPLGLPGTVTQGIVSAQDRPVVVGGGANADAPTAYINAIQTDAPINPGNSGGPLIDAAGRVIGVNSAILTLGSAQGQTGNIGLGFAIPVSQARQIGQQLVERGKASYPVIGATVEDVSGGVRLRTVEDNGPADDAGLRTGDVITRIDDQQVRTSEELIVAIRTRRPGQRVALDYTRGSADRSARVTLGSKEG